MQNTKKHRTFAPAYRDLAQLVAHTSGGREVAGSSPVIPTESKRVANCNSFFFLHIVSSVEIWKLLLLECSILQYLNESKCDCEIEALKDFFETETGT